MDTNITLYDVNKQIYGQQKPYDPIFLNKKIKEIVNDMYQIKYAMLLCRERNDYTLFNVKKEPWMAVDDIQYGKDLFETLNNRGQIIAIEKQDTPNTWEIWIKDVDLNEVYAYYFFNAENMVITIGGK